MPTPVADPAEGTEATQPPYRRATAWFTDRNWLALLSVDRLQRSRAVGRGVRVAIVLPLVMGSFTLAGLPNASFLGAFAVILLLVTSDFSGPRPERAASMATIATAGAVTLVLGALLSGHLWLLLPTALVLGAGVVLVGALRGFLSQGTVPILLPFFIAATNGPSLPTTVQMLAGWCIGSAVAILAAVTLWPYFPRRAIIESLTSAMRAQADLMEALWRPGASPESVAEEYANADEQVRRTLELYSGRLRRPGSMYRRERFIVRLVEETRRLRIALRMAYRRLPLQPAPGSRELISEAADAMREAADQALAGKGDLAPFERLNVARDVHRSTVVSALRSELAAGDAGTAQEDATSAFRPRLVSLLAQTTVRDAGVMHGNEQIPHLMFRGRRLPTVVQQVEPGQRLRAELSWRAPWMRNAMRLGLAVALALSVVTVTGVERGYWVVLGTLSVLRMDLRGTGRSSWQVIQGQLLGFALGLGLIEVLDGKPWLGWILLPLLAGLQGYMANNVAVVWQQAGFTVLLVDLVSLTAPSRSIVFLRLEDVALGMVVAVVVSLLVFPRGLVPQVRQALRRSSEASADFLVAATGLVAARAEGQREVEPPDGHATRKAVERAAETIDLALAQGIPQGAQTMLWMRLLAVVEYVTYLAQVIATVGKAYPTDSPEAAVAASLRECAVELRPRLIADAEMLLDTAEAAEGLQSLPDYQNTGEFSPTVDRALASIDDAVAEWARDRRAEMAEPAIELYWTLGWLSEVDLMIANNTALVAAVEAEGAERATS